MSAALLALALLTAPDTGWIAGPDGVRLYYQKIGSGAPTIIVPGHLFLASALAPLAKRHTLILYDMRNRGRSSRVEDGRLITIQKDVEDLEAVRRHFGVERFVPIGYSYLGLMIVLYAMDHPERVQRLVQLGPVPRRFDTEYPPGLLHHDSIPVVSPAADARLDSLERAGWLTEHPQEFCEESRVREVRLVGDPAKAARLPDLCDMPNEWPVNLRRHFDYHFVGVQRLHVPREALTRVEAPVLTIHGTWDRNAPYAAGREWALTLPDARLITVEGAAHQLVTDAPEIVLPAIDEFVAGRWPSRAEKITSLERSPM